MTKSSMNYLALNQTILGKTMVVGEGFSKGLESEPKTTRNGVPIYINGVNIMPELSQSIVLWPLGKLYHPYLLTGMPGIGGEVEYLILVTENEFSLLATLKLDESQNGPSEPAER